MKKVYIYNRYNRFWHWAQASLILFLAITGFEIHGTYNLFGYEKAVYLHNNSAWALIILTIFTIFWDFAVGEWKQYVPTIKMIKEQFKYYISGIFHNAPHPTHKTKYNKFNPLQRITYFGLKFVIIPVMVFSGLLYFFFFSNLSNGVNMSLGWIAYTHAFGAFFLIGFVILHVYLTTTGEKVFSSIKAMITGWEEMSDEDAEYAIEEGLRVKLSEISQEVSSSHKEELLDKTLKNVEETFGFKHEFELKHAIDDAGVGYFRIGADGRYQEVNEGWLKLYKCTTLDEVIGRPIGLNRDGEDKQKVVEIFNRVMAGETIKSGELKRICSTGDVGFHSFTASPVKDDEGNIIGIEGFIIDTTEQHKQ